MNSEELELSLRSEFEAYLKNIVERMRGETRDFQASIEAEFDKHRAQMDEAFRAFTERFGSDTDLDEAFRSSVSEHLRLSRDEGAKLAATAMDEAERMERESQPQPEPAPARYDAIRDAVNDISTKDSQSSILKSLVEQAEAFASRGAFFIIRNEHFVGWKQFGGEGDVSDDAVRDINFPVSGETILGQAVRSLSSAGGPTSDADQAYLGPLNFSGSESAVAIPLVARGRGVAVLYADAGPSGGAVNREALETITRVAGLTVELLAAGAASRDSVETTANAEQPAYSEQPAAETQPAYAEPAPQHQEAPVQESHGYQTAETHEDVSYGAPATGSEPPSHEEPHYGDFETAQTQDTSYGAFTDSYHEQTPAETEYELPRSEPAPEYDPFSPDTSQTGFSTSFDQPEETPYQAEIIAEPEVSQHEEYASTQPEETDSYSEPANESPIHSPFAPEPEFPRSTGAGDNAGAMVFGSERTEESPSPSPFEQPVGEYEHAGAVNSPFSKAVEPVPESKPVASIPQSRLSDRNVDLPIDVPEEERRLHNDARRFARLLVSEIKLYNEKKVLEGRQAHDLYDRLREAIDRSREMYDKRVQPPVAAKFDYFHYELLNSLAEGNVERLGSGYPGPTI